jgi:uncharacterized cupredoxin-like copper-binding protein
MNTRVQQLLDVQISRRTALRTAGVAGVASFVASRGIAFAQDATPPAAAGGTSYPELTITATDYHFDLPASIAGGWTKVTLVNNSESDHHAMLMRPIEGKTIDDVTAALKSPDLGALLGVAESIGGGNTGPGSTASTIVNIDPGSYMVVCAIPGPDGMPHYMMGMQAPLDVTDAAGDASAPAADATITLVEMSFDGLPTDVTAGEQTWEVTNGGEQLHEFIVMKLSPGVTFDMAKGILMSSTEATPAAAAASPPPGMAMQGPPFVELGGAAPMSPSYTNYPVLNLEAGDYFAICFVPDAATGAPHYTMGMIAPFTAS